MRKTVPIGDVGIHPLNIRLIRPAENVDRLAASIKKDGLEYPLKVVPGPDGKFLCWDGGYRLSACIAAGLKEVDIDIEEIKDETELIIRSFNAADKMVPLNLIEEAKAFKTLWIRLETQEKLCEAVGRRPSYINDRLALLRLNSEAQKLVMDGKMSMRPALRLSDHSKDMQARVLQILGGPGFATRHPAAINRYSLYYVDEAIAEAEGRREKKIFPSKETIKGSSDWACQHCGKHYKITCLGHGKHFFERVN